MKFCALISVLFVALFLVAQAAPAVKSGKPMRVGKPAEAVKAAKADRSGKQGVIDVNIWGDTYCTFPLRRPCDASLPSLFPAQSVRFIY